MALTLAPIAVESPSARLNGARWELALHDQRGRVIYQFCGQLAALGGRQAISPTIA
jgi:hypothetical protein